MKRKVFGIIILAMTVCLCSCGADATGKKSEMTSPDTQTEETVLEADSEENDFGISAKEILQKLEKDESLEYAKIKICSDVTFLIQSNQDTSFIKNYENKENTYAEISKNGGSYCTIEQEWIGNGEKGVITANQYLKDDKIYYNYVDASSTDAWYVTEAEDIWKDVDNSFVQSLIPGSVALTEKGGYVLTGTTDPEKGRRFLDMILQYRVRMLDEFALNYELVLDQDFHFIQIKFTLDKPYKEMPNAVDEYDENWTIKVITVQSFELECYDIDVKNEIVLPEAAADATPIK